MTYRLDSYFNPHVAPGSTRVDAVLTVTSDGIGGPSAAAGGERCVAFGVDCSGSMFEGGVKIEAAKVALRKAIAALPDDVSFTVVAFGSSARVVFPMTRATAASRFEADRVVQRLTNLGGTVMSQCLSTIREAFQKHPGANCFAYFLTDGQNGDSDNKALELEVARCKGVFQCDCRGVGTDWSPTQIRVISNGLLGTSDAVADPAGLEADFRKALAGALSRGARLRLDLWMPGTARLVSLRQMQPEVIDVTKAGTHASQRVTSFDLGSFGSEQRDYSATFEVEAGDVGEEMLVCRPSLAVPGDAGELKVPGANVVATWSDDADATARITPEVAHYTGQGELSASIAEGLEARRRGDEAEATRLLGKAAKIAHDSGNDEVTRRLTKVVDLVDAGEGTVRLKAADRGAALELEMSGTRTVRRNSRS